MNKYTKLIGLGFGGAVFAIVVIAFAWTANTTAHAACNTNNEIVISGTFHNTESINANPKDMMVKAEDSISHQFSGSFLVKAQQTANYSIDTHLSHVGAGKVTFYLTWVPNNGQTDSLSASYDGSSIPDCKPMPTPTDTPTPTPTATPAPTITPTPAVPANCDNVKIKDSKNTNLNCNDQNQNQTQSQAQTQTQIQGQNQGQYQSTDVEVSNTNSDTNNYNPSNTNNISITIMPQQ